MKKYIFCAALAALTLTACSDSNNQIFDQSAAERLEQYKKDYAEVLTADGGMWSMEYFANPEEEGYVFVMKFDTNGSVLISANHKWIGGVFKQETSLWKMIADNGPVLSFDSYNTLFHIFSDPANITGPDAPTGEDGDINETGYGHDGDYEFQVMEVSEDRNTVRLLGKKRSYDIYLRRLDPNTNVEDYLTKVAAVPEFIVPYFGYFNLVAADGEPFIIKDLKSGVPSIYPKDGDAVSQTRSGNLIFTTDGIRFMKDLEVPRADESKDPLILSSFSVQPDGSYLSADGDKIVGPYPVDAFFFETFDYFWYIDIDNCKGKIATLIQNLEKGLKEAYPTRSIESVAFGYDVLDGEIVNILNIKISGTRAASYYLDFSSKSADNIKFSISGSNSQAATFAKKTAAINDFAEELAKFSFSVSSADVMSPVVLSMTDNSDSNNVVTLEIQ